MLTEKQLWANLVVLLICILATSCDDPQPNLISQQKVSLMPTPALEYIRSLGYSDSTVEELDDAYIVEGDMIFKKKLDYSSRSAKNGRGQQATDPVTGMNDRGGLVSMAKVQNMTIYIDYTVPQTSYFRSVFPFAINDWNNTPDNMITFTLVTSGPADIQVSNTSMTSQPAYAELPLNGSVGHQLLLNSTFVAGNPALRYVIVHELGHMIGLRHTDWNAPTSETTANNIIGTPCSDPNSIMGRYGVGTRNWAGFSQFDVLAVQVMYPIARPAGVVPLYRYVAQFGIGDHFYTTNWNEIGCGFAGYYVLEGFACYLYPSAIAGSIPIHRYVNGSNDHFYTLVQQNYSGYTYENIAGYAYSYQASGTVPIYRYVANSSGEHFYTKVQYPYPGYTYEMIAWYAFP